MISNMRNIQTRKVSLAIVVWIVVVPLEAIGVCEEGYVLQILIIVDNVPCFVSVSRLISR